jgi:signal transduction histidine kinase
MNTPATTLPCPAAVAAAWDKSPWGTVAIDSAGNVCSINPGFLQYCTQSEAELIGMSEGTLHGLLLSLGVERRRVEVSVAGLRAIYYVRHVTPATTTKHHLTGIAELLREPMASIQGFAELLLTQNYDEETRRELTATLLSQIETMSNIINQQLDITRDLP